MKIYNNNPKYGESGPFESESFETLADEMSFTFEEMATEDWYTFTVDSGETIEQYVKESSERKRIEFIAGLEEVFEHSMEEMIPSERAMCGNCINVSEAKCTCLAWGHGDKEDHEVDWDQEPCEDYKRDENSFLA